MTQIAYKVLEADGSAIYGRGSWPLPRGKGPGKWLEHNGPLIPCQSGLHLCRRGDLARWLGPTLWVAEYEGDPVEADDKIVVAKARLVGPLQNWNDTTARLFAADCAARAVRMRRREGIQIDRRVDAAIRVARRFALGQATDEERSAAESAAESAARSAAGSAAWSAAWSAWSAAWSAAESAAGSAAYAAAESARSAAESAARSAARSAAGSAERRWQTTRLWKYLGGELPQ